MPEITELNQLLRNGALECIMPVFGQVQARKKADGSLVTKADLAMNDYVRQELTKRWPDIQFLSEEMSTEEHSQLFQSSQALWILDPLDGTTNFANGIPFFAISLALIEAGELKLGIVYDPVREECFSAVAGEAACLNGVPIEKPVVPEHLKESVANIDFKRLPADLRNRIVKEVPYTSQRSFGSGALDWCWLAIGRGHIYLHGKQNVWDYIAGQMILNQAHGMCCDLKGERVFTGDMQSSSAVAAATPEMFQQWRNWLGINN